MKPTQFRVDVMELAIRRLISYIHQHHATSGCDSAALKSRADAAMRLLDAGIPENDSGTDDVAPGSTPAPSPVSNID